MTTAARSRRTNEQRDNREQQHAETGWPKPKRGKMEKVLLPFSLLFRRDIRVTPCPRTKKHLFFVLFYRTVA